MKRLLLITTLFICAFDVSAQFPGGAPANGKGMQQTPSIGHVYGKLVDRAGKPIGEASVVILQNRFDSVAKKRKDILLQAVATQANGEFSFSELPVFGALKLKVTAIGFKPAEQTVTFEMKMPAGAS